MLRHFVHNAWYLHNLLIFSRLLAPEKFSKLMNIQQEIDYVLVWTEDIHHDILLNLLCWFLKFVEALIYRTALFYEVVFL